MKQDVRSMCVDRLGSDWMDEGTLARTRNYCPVERFMGGVDLDDVQLTIVQPAANTIFRIPEGLEMPVIQIGLGFTSKNWLSRDWEQYNTWLVANLLPRLIFTGSAQIRYHASDDPHGPDRHINLDVPIGNSRNPVRVRFPEIRGGKLEVTLVTFWDDRILSVKSNGWQIIGTDPSRASLREAMPHLTGFKIALQESNGGHQFLNGHPLWNEVGDGGVGLMQITRYGNPPHGPTDDEVWSWISNLNRGIAILNEKRASARNYPGRVRHSHAFQDAVAEFNAARGVQNLPPLHVEVPEFTTGDFDQQILEQREMDAIRGYNGWAGDDDWGHELHEFRIARDAQDMLIVDELPNHRGTVRWVRVPAADRPPHVGDPNYVNHVINQNP